MMRRIGMLFFLVVSSAQLRAANDDYSRWLYYRNITLNTTASGANIGSTISQFPLLIRLTAADEMVFKTSRKKGLDVRFADFNGNHLKYQIERWDSTAKVAELWVLATVNGNDNTQYVRMYWGNSAASDSSDGTAVFATTNGFAGVWHLTNNNFSDATSNNATITNTGTTDTASVIGTGRKFVVSSSNYLQVAGLAGSPSMATLSCWAKVDSIDGNFSRSDVISIGDHLSLMVERNSAGTRDSIVGQYYTGSYQSLNQPGGSGVLKQGWKYLTFMCNPAGSSNLLYINGAQVASNAVNGTMSYNGGNTCFGRTGSGGSSMYLGGVLNEVRIENTNRTADWIKLCFQNQQIGSSMVTGGTPVAQPPGNLSYTVNSIILKSGTAMTPDTATWNGGVESFTVSPALPAGLAIDNKTGIISGTASGLASSGAYVVTAQSSVGSTTFSVNITVYVQPLITQQPVSRTVTMGNQALFFIKDSGTALSFLWIGSGPINVNPPPNDTLKFKADTAQDNWIYRCRIKNTYGDSVWSLPCTLHVQIPPTITNPLSLTVADSSSNVTFTVQAKGRPYPAFAWIRNATPIAGATSPSLILSSVHGADDKATFKCVATNAAGSASSALCTLRVVSANFGATPRTGFDSMTVTFTDSSTGGIGKYKWDFGDGDTTGSAAASPAHTYKRPGTPPGAPYTVKQTVTAITTTDTIIQSLQKTGYITVNYSKPRPAFMADTLQGEDSLLVHFQDVSKGVVTSRKWSFGDGSADTAAFVSHLYKTTGSYTVKLTVTGPGGVDSLIQANYIFVYSKTDNPIRIKGRRLSTSGVELTFSNYKTIATSAKTSTPPFADTLGLWFKPGSMPSSPQTDSLLKKYSLIQMQKDTSGLHKDTIAVPLSPPWAPVYYGFNTALYWNDLSKSPMKPGNGDSLLMQDTVRPVNNLTISGAYAAADSAVITLGNISGLDSTLDSLIGIWYGFKDSADFSNAASTHWFSMSAVAAKAAGNTFTYVIRDALKFNSGDTIRVYAAAAVMGKNRLQSAVADTSFRAGRLRPANPARLFAKAIDPAQIQLRWQDKTTGKALTGVDSIIIWQGTKAVPALNPAQPAYKPLRPSAGDTALMITALSEKTRYFFGAQVSIGGLWSAITDSASATDSTPAVQDFSRPPNTVKNVSLRFDSTQNRVMVLWRFDAVDTSLDVGISYSLTGYPTDTSRIPGQIVPVKAALDSAALKLGEALAFDSTYYVSLVIRKGEGKWSLTSSSSVAKIQLPGISWQTVTYFTKFPDTVSAFGGRVLLANGPGDSTSTTDKLISDSTARSSLNGFIPVSMEFHFQQKLPTPAFYIGLALDTASIPPKYGKKAVRIYRDSAGSWLVERGTVVNTERSYAWVKTRNLDFPFIAMIDTIPPSITVKNVTDAPVVGGVLVSDTFSIADNVANMSWSYRFARGEDSYDAGDSVVGMSQGKNDVVYASIPGVKVNQNNGTRALMIVGDGVNWDTVDVSRQVYCDSMLNVVKTTPNLWYPLQVTTNLDSTGAPYVLRGLAKPGQPWYYDNTKFRLFRWYTYEGNADSAQQWVEYSPKTSSMFVFDPGKLFWIKTRVPATLNLGSSKTSSLRQAAAVVLAGKAVTDFSLPLGFDVRIGDVFASTDADTFDNSGTHADSLQLYQFVADSTGHYRSEPLFLSRLSSIVKHSAEKSDTLHAKTGGGYCVYNPYSTPVTLRVPPVPVSMSKFHGAAAKKAQHAGGSWALAIRGRTEEGIKLSTVYCGHDEGKTGQAYYPAMPMMAGVGIRVCDERHRQFGHAISRSIASKAGGETFTLALCNESGGARQIVYDLSGMESLPRGMQAEIIDPATGNSQDAAAPQSVTLGDGETTYRHLVAGTDAYRASVKKGLQVFRLALAGAYPNPFIAVLKIRYNLPETGLDAVRFSLVNISGRQVWERTVACGKGLSGSQEMVWDARGSSGGPVASGMYVLRMTAMDARGKTVAAFEKKITALPR